MRSFLSGSIIEGRDLDALKCAVMERLRVKSALLCGSGSLALEIALRVYGVGEGHEVIMPTFCCSSIVPPVLSVGASPVLADVGDDLNINADTAAAVVTAKTRAIIVPHLFGNPANIKAIVDFAHQKNIRVIDDAAQALGATIDGRPVGSFGDVGILSFGSEKVCFGVGGGMVVSRQQELLNSHLKIDLSEPDLSSTLQNFLSTLVWWRWRRWTLPLQKWLSHAKTAGPDSTPSPYRREILANLNAAVARSLVETLDGNIAARRLRIRAYQELLGSEEGLTLLPHRPGSACLTQVVRILPISAGDDLSARLIGALRQAGYEIQGSYVPIHLLSHWNFPVQKRLSHAERIWTDLIELPCEPEVNLRHIETIAAAIKKALKKPSTPFRASLTPLRLK